VTAIPLFSLPDSVRVVEVGLRDGYRRACAFLILEEGHAPISLLDVQTFLLGRGLAKYKLPERLEFVSDFPLTNVGKVSKNHLRDRIARSIGG
jgi:2,3-dihydroxybenzoate-AMP ligase